ncbi:unnamed protein product [Victoria cruziana]
MAQSMARSTLRNLNSLRGAILRRSSPKNADRKFSSSALHDDDHETRKWERITYVGIAACSALAFYNLSKGHPHYDSPPPYEYLHIRNKEFPWGPDGLFEKKHH